MKYNQSYALRRKLFGRLKYFWKFAYISGKFDTIVLRKRYRTKDKVLKVKTINHKDYGNKLFIRDSRKRRKTRDKKNAQLQRA